MRWFRNKRLERMETIILSLSVEMAEERKRTSRLIGYLGLREGRDALNQHTFHLPEKMGDKAQRKKR